MKKPGFFIEYNDWKTILYYAKARQSTEDHEIGGMLIAKLDKDGDWVLQDPVILKQTTSGSNCTLDKDELSNYYIDMASKHGKGIKFVWWHSHAAMNAFWSETDKRTMEESSSSEWSMFLVVNIKEEYKFRVQIWKPIKAGEDIELGFINGPSSSIPKEIVKEVEEKCSKEYTTGKTWTRYGQQYNYNNNQLIIGNQNNEIRDYNASFGQYDEDIAYNYMTRQIDSLNNQLCSGQIKHNAYRKKINSLNKKLNKAEVDFKIKIPRDNNELDTFIQSHFPADFFIDKDTGQPYEEDTTYGGILYA
tara:strand:- start:261 stop:1172 length:912 start_codon:yes stop_codon:yes gene_type:complete